MHSFRVKNKKNKVRTPTWELGAPSHFLLFGRMSSCVYEFNTFSAASRSRLRNEGWRESEELRQVYGWQSKEFVMTTSSGTQYAHQHKHAKPTTVLMRGTTVGPRKPSKPSKLSKLLRSEKT
ncbi:hypothetical protein EYF80_029122 [Liparis tanakae]|uniref:Uncharacterized protein n=1 Tax=Liparis tanakae TaxID=230148 RepID=A0A4Z2H4G4_9TELE|nr:hypothetical protein EYF80_029122 [Liparis tanakae]